MGDLSDALARARAEEARKARNEEAARLRHQELERARAERGRLLATQFVEEARRAGLTPDFHVIERVDITEQDSGRYGWRRIKVHRLTTRRVSCWALHAQGAPSGNVALEQLGETPYLGLYFLDEAGNRRTLVRGSPQPVLPNLRTFESRQRRTLTFESVPPFDSDIVYDVWDLEMSRPVFLEQALVEYLLHRTR